MNNELYLIIIFVMAMMLGYELIKKIPPTLHTPLMSGTNAISGIVIIGSILVITSTLLDSKYFRFYISSIK